MLKRQLTEWTGTPGPVRTLVLAQLATTMGNGAFMTCSALYFTRVVGFSPAQLGVGLSAAGIAGVFAGVPFGHLADQRGARGVAALLIALTGVTTVVYAFLDSYTLFVLVACAYALFDRGGYAARQALMGAVLEGRDLVAARARLRVVTNIGMSAGAALGAVVLQLDIRAGYVTLLLLDGLSFLGCALLVMRLPRAEPAPARPPGEPRLAVLRDRPYALVALLNMVLTLHVPLLDVILPLWISLHTDAPRALTAVLIVLNTVCVVLFQVRVSRGVDALAPAVRAFRVAGFTLTATCVFFALSAGRPAWAAIMLLVVAAGLHVYGEMVQSAASWVVAYELAPADRQGQYQGLFNTGVAANQMLAPAVLTFLLIGWGTPGWLLLGGVFLLAAWAIAPATRWAESSLARASDDDAPALRPA